jgi:hypothetical protein
MPLSLPQTQLGEHGYAIGIRDIALHVLPCNDVLKFRNQWNQADITIDDFLIGLWRLLLSYVG